MESRWKRWSETLEIWGRGTLQSFKLLEILVRQGERPPAETPRGQKSSYRGCRWINLSTWEKENIVFFLTSPTEVTWEEQSFRSPPHTSTGERKKVAKKTNNTEKSKCQRGSHDEFYKVVFCEVTPPPNIHGNLGDTLLGVSKGHVTVSATCATVLTEILSYRWVDCTLFTLAANRELLLSVGRITKPCSFFPTITSEPFAAGGI